MKRIYFLFLTVLAVAAATAGPRKVAQKSIELSESSISYAAPELQFADLGEGLMTDAMVTEWYQMAPVTYKVKIQKAEGAEIYRVLAPYGQTFADAMLATNNIGLKDNEYDKAGTCILEIDATDPDNVYFPKTMIGCDWGAGEMYIGIPTTGKVVLRDGIFSAGPRNVAVGDDTGAVALNVSGKFRIVLPGVTPTDYEMTLTAASHCITDFTFKGNLSVGNDIAKVYYAIFTDFQEDEILSAYGEVMSRKYEFAARGDFSFKMNGDGDKETLVLVGVNADGEEVAYAWTTYYDITSDPADWVSIGFGNFTDPFLPALLNCESETLRTEIQAHRSIAGYLRLVNPYATSKYATPSYYHGAPDGDHPHYIYINGTDPECIYIEESPLCFDFGYGICRVSSFVYYFLQAGFDLEECKELELGGIFENHVLTFPEEALNFSMLGYDNGDWYYTDPEKGDFALTLPEGYDFSAVSTISVDTPANAPVEYFNLQGTRIDNPAPGTLVIRRQGTTTQKLIVRK